MKNKLMKLKFKNRFKYKQYLFIKVRQWFGIVHHISICPNFKYKNTSVILFRYMITNTSNGKL